MLYRVPPYSFFQRCGSPCLDVAHFLEGTPPFPFHKAVWLKWVAYRWQALSWQEPATCYFCPLPRTEERWLWGTSCEMSWGFSVPLFCSSVLWRREWRPTSRYTLWAALGWMSWNEALFAVWQEVQHSNQFFVQVYGNMTTVLALQIRCRLALGKLEGRSKYPNYFFESTFHALVFFP